MRKKIFQSILLTAVTALVLSFLMAILCLHRYFGNVQDQHLKRELNLAAGAVEEVGLNYLEKMENLAFRLTWVEADGTVRYDTETRVETMENHADREEIAEALSDGEGSSIRYSTTRMEKTIYYATALSDGTVLRISISEATSLKLLLGIVPLFLLVAALAAILSWVLAGRMAKRIVTPLNRVDLDHPLENDAYEEISPLLGRIHHQHQQIQAQLQELRQKTEEFLQITGNMREALVLLDSKGDILSINPAACSLFNVGPDCVGMAFLAVDRSYDMHLAIQAAMESGHTKVRAEHRGRKYQLDISRIETEGVVRGTVILAFDVTEQEAAERSRREFTANVSHELKTPLQSIIGSAELIENQLVRPEDMPRFVGHMRKEAARLVNLIEDIIRLSQLDEGSEMPKEEVSLRALTEEVFSTLRDAANSKQVGLSVVGDDGVVFGVRRLLYEVIYNLCDNAVKYNVDGGSVQVEIREDDTEIAVTVKDTGIGIAPEHQSRIFERFYRVDKSHSKQSGGTGLGLSIVKHAVQYHHGTIRMESVLGEGTAITVVFQKQTD